MSMMPVLYKLLLAIAYYFTCADANFSGGGIGRTLLFGRAHHTHQRARKTSHQDAIIAVLRGGGNGIEENPEFGGDDTDDGCTDNSSSDGTDSDCSDDEQQLHDSDSDDDEEITTKVSKSKNHYTSSQQIKVTTQVSKSRNKSFNKRVLKFVKRNQYKLYILLAIIAFRREIHHYLLLIVPTSIRPTDVLKLIVLGILVKEVMCRYVLPEDSSSVIKYDKDEDGNRKNQTQPMEQSSSSPSKPMLPIVLLLSLLLIPAIRRNFTMFSYFFLPIIIQSLSGESDPDSPLGRFLLMFGRGDKDLATRMAYMPPLEQHYAFEQLNERYYRDWGAWRKGFPTNPMVVGPTATSEGATGAGHESGGATSGGSITSMISSLLLLNRRKSLSSPSPHAASKTTDNAPLTKVFPSEYNNGTVIVLDMTKLDTQASKMESIRDQISFIIHLVESEDSSYFSGQTDKGQQSSSDVPMNATHLYGNETVSSTNTTTNDTSIESNGSKSSPSPIVEVIVLLESPGGGVSQYGLAASHLQRLQKTSNVCLTICVDNVAASGGYMMACMSSPGQLYCAPFAMVGSIGVIGQSLNVQKTLESYGVRPYVFRGGKMKNPVGMVGDVTKEGISAMQDSVDRIHDAFRDHVKSARREAFTEAMLSEDAFSKGAGNYFQMGSQASPPSASIEQVMDQVATGDVFLGVQALKLGLVDRLVTSDEYIAERIRHGSRVLKLINHHRQPAGLSSVFMGPSPRSQLSLETRAGNNVLGLLERIVCRMKTALVAWADDGLTSGSVPHISAQGQINENIKMKLAAELKKILHIGDHVGRVLVLDGADPVGHRVVEHLIDAGCPDLRVGMRTLREKEETRGIEMVPFVWENEDTYSALKDVNTVFVTLPVKPSNWDEHFPQFLKACTTNNVKRIVKLSFYHAIKSKTEHRNDFYGEGYISSHDGFHDVPLVHKHALCDGDLILHKGLDVTLLLATHLMSNVFRRELERSALKEKHEFYGASGGKGVNYVSPNDVAHVAVKAILDKAHQRQTCTLTGPHAITDNEIATLLSEQLGTKITYVDKPLDFFDEDTAALEKIKATGLEENFPKGDFKKVVGRDAETFEDYLKVTHRMSPIEQVALSLVAPLKEAEPLTTGNEEEKEEEVEEIDSTETEVEVAEKKVHGDATPEQAHPVIEAQ
ncbi:hypothetical protein ACHAXR_011105 [Thalassiosira sp. AJA248-18]